MLKTNLLGTATMVRRRLEAYREAGIATLRVEPAGETLDERLATLGRLCELVRALPDAAERPARVAPGAEVASLIS